LSEELGESPLFLGQDQGLDQCGGRLKKSGMHRSVAGANAILALRCTIKIGRYESFWERKASQWVA
jgi:hypothetical protein